jgi:effector-binding domain-containing protein
MHYEPGVIVGRAFAAAGDVIPSQLPGGRVVKYTLVGSFEQLPQAWPALFAWCQENGLRREGWFWQIYEPPARDPAAQATHLYALLA